MVVAINIYIKGHITKRCRNLSNDWFFAYTTQRCAEKVKVRKQNTDRNPNVCTIFQRGPDYKKKEDKYNILNIIFDDTIYCYIFVTFVSSVPTITEKIIPYIILIFCACVELSSRNYMTREQFIIDMCLRKTIRAKIGVIMNRKSIVYRVQRHLQLSLLQLNNLAQYDRHTSLYWIVFFWAHM